MELEKGKSIRLNQTGTIEDFALTVLTFTNLKQAEDTGVYEVSTVEGTNTIIIECAEDVEKDVISTAERHGASLIDSSDIAVYLIEDIDEYRKDIADKLESELDKDEPAYFIHVVDKRF